MEVFWYIANDTATPKKKKKKKQFSFPYCEHRYINTYALPEIMKL